MLSLLNMNRFMWHFGARVFFLGILGFRQCFPLSVVLIWPTLPASGGLSPAGHVGWSFPGAKQRGDSGSLHVRTGS